MDIKKQILRKLKAHGKVTSKEIVTITGFSRAYVNRFFQALRDEGQIVLVGRANTAKYVPATSEDFKKTVKKILSVSKELTNRDLHEDKVLKDIKKQTGIYAGLRKNVSAILDYAFTEMLNNAIDHSLSAKINVIMKKEEDVLVFNVKDSGVGIFNNIMKKNKLSSQLHAAESLMKGKETTMPEKHSGEGIFFTSKLCDVFVIQSRGIKLTFNNIIEDIFLANSRNLKGTKIIFSIKCDSTKKIEKVFRRYTNNAYEFSKTQVHIKLYKMSDGYISRSQARRVLAGLDKFKEIILDFKGVNAIGQGFADELFRIWHYAHPDIKIITKNADKLANFMIQRADKKLKT